MTATTETAPPKRLPPRRIIRIDLPGEWKGFWVIAWVNADWQRRGRLLATKKEDEARDIIGEFILDHNLTDFDGADLPKVSDPAFFERVPSDALAVIFREILGQFGKLSPQNAGTSKPT